MEFQRIRNLLSYFQINKHRKQTQELFRTLFADSNKGKYSFADRKEGMMMGWQGNCRRSFLINKNTEEAWEMVDADGILCWDSYVVKEDAVQSLTYPAKGNAVNMMATFYFGIEHYKDGVTCVSWTLQPDGSYYVDEDGFGMDDDPEITFYAFMDKYCNILVPFQPMNNDLRERFQKQAVAIAKKRNCNP